ncbi:inorganic pyrophosphatase [Zychaea mexicana]|uniref:inorganic pyrophosphatase n=1 Tax=Zychaea mexicana TaxID=64656 RepID=UPI0022FEC5B1|nr:inorganic pyrophosphatase [Zychaea mexicana]KAI9494609.1 inorganic pyrophosphatase [Zychaea mexicana]
MHIYKATVLIFAVQTIATVVASSIVLPEPKLVLSNDDDHYNEKRCADVDCLYRIRSKGSLNTKDFTLYLENSQGVPISIFHDLPLQPMTRSDPDIFNMVVEIPRWSFGKWETNKETVMNPIKQDCEKNGTLRFLPNLFPIRGYPVNYGAFMQTFEDPHYITPETGTKGDNDPIDVVELSETPGYIGQVKQVKILGGLCLIDQHATDWKVVTIDIKDPMAQNIDNMDDVEQYYPGLQDVIRNWYRDYKVPSTGHQNTFGFADRYLDKEYMTSVIYETHGLWRALINGKTDRNVIQTATLTNKNSPYKVNANSPEVRSVPKNDPQPSTPPPEKYQRWSFVPSSKDQS